jgi:hypothetical protein
MPISTPMNKVADTGRFKLYKAYGLHFLHQGYFLWTGKRHIQVWPLWRFGRSGDR